MIGEIPSRALSRVVCWIWKFYADPLAPILCVTSGFEFEFIRSVFTADGWSCSCKCCCGRRVCCKAFGLLAHLWTMIGEILSNALFKLVCWICKFVAEPKAPSTGCAVQFEIILSVFTANGCACGRSCSCRRCGCGGCGCGGCGCR